MKKIDLHLHTVASLSDTNFTFSLNKLKEYLSSMAIDCIAITNHNLFDHEQYQTIISDVQIPVFPGIEIDLEGGHMLLISDNKDLDEFKERCDKVTVQIKNNTDYITLSSFRSIFPDLSKYLLIPHYDKKPEIKPSVIAALKEYITSGEVASIRKFKSCMKEQDSLVPVIFSDLRFSENMGAFSLRGTFVDLEQITFAGLKLCLFDKAKVFLSKNDGNELFQILNNGLKISTGVNVVLGERSSGKTFILEEINKSFGKVKYLQQFSLLQNDDERFNELTSNRNSNISENFLEELKDVVEDVINIDLEKSNLDVEKYINTLLKFASENETLDTFSKTALFSETLYPEVTYEALKKLIESTVSLIENTEYRNIIDRHLPIDNLKKLAIDLMKHYIEMEESSQKKKWVNGLVTNIKQELRFRTANTHPEDIDLHKILKDIKRIEKFSHIISNIKKEREIDRKEFGSFKIIARTKKFINATHLKTKSRKTISFVGAFASYEEPFFYLQHLKGMNLEIAQLYKYFVDIEFVTLNKHNYPVSGGERSEFNLLHEINDALKHDILLLDEPESSFDNLFLKSEVNKLIKDIAKEIPVIVVTHNSTVGASIKPDYVIYTQKKIEDGNIKYKIYSGFPSDKELKNLDGEAIMNFDVMLDCLEAGIEAYTERKNQSYEILKN